VPQTAADGPLLRVEGVRKCYREGDRSREVLTEIHLLLQRGDRLALLGRSGSGKSTLLNLLAGIDRADSGHIFLGGEEIGALGEPARTLLRRRIGFIYQFFNLLPTLTAAGFAPEAVRQRVAEILEAVGLGTRGEAFPDQLSGGEQQRVAIARALIHQPDLVLADEPTGNLDAETGAQVLGLLQRLFSDRRQSLILVTHSLQVAQIADRILTLERGTLRAGPERFAW
jgi:putative ABC transport system ATP-binding protein